MTDLPWEELPVQRQHSETLTLAQMRGEHGGAGVRLVTGPYSMPQAPRISFVQVLRMGAGVPEMTVASALGTSQASRSSSCA